MKHLASSSFFLVLAIVVWWSITKDLGDKAEQSLKKSEDYAEIFMNEFEMTAMNENGSPDYILNGDHLSREAGSDDTNIEQPVFQLLRQDERWHIVADTAIVNDKNKTIQLNDNVVMRQKHKKPAIVIRTRNMLIHTDTQVARTEAPVELSRGESRIQSNGMIFDNKSSELELLSDVNGYYLPND